MTRHHGLFSRSEDACADERSHDYADQKQTELKSSAHIRGDDAMRRPLRFHCDRARCRSDAAGGAVLLGATGLNRTRWTHVSD